VCYCDINGNYVQVTPQESEVGYIEEVGEDRE
jgi:hypothetical protein